jgi:diguanylate cyclase (GGDEF)-like protein/putative nucleotidyltransferase with HDIG domain
MKELETIQETTAGEGKSTGWLAACFMSAQVLAGLPLVAYALWHWQSEDAVRFASFLVVAIGASALQIKLPAIPTTMPVNFLFVLVGILDLSFPETIVVGCIGGLGQLLWRANPRPKVLQLLTHFANLAIAITAAEAVFQSRVPMELRIRWPLLLAASSAVYFVLTTFYSAVLIAISERRNAFGVWNESFLRFLPYYLLGALIAGAASIVNQSIGWQVTLLAAPIFYWIYRSYRTYVDRLESEKKHTEEIAALHMRTIEALSLAIEAKDHNSQDHLNRVQTFAVEIGKELKVSEDELSAVRAAALLHDIGKLAVPEHILSKPGKLTPEEFEKMKIHPVVGAEILNRVEFPYPVVPIVRAHHEKWNGEGYPDGLKGEEIPIGARILSVVDTYDAMTSARPYRRAITPEEAIQFLRTHSGKSFDPRVVGCMERRYREFEAAVMVSGVPERLVPSVASPMREAARLTGTSSQECNGEVRNTSFLASIVSARQEAQLLFELAHTLGNSLSLRETLSVVAVRLKEMIPHQSIVFFISQGAKLVPKYVHGIDYSLFTSLEIPLGEGLSGWVALNRKPILNGDPAAETRYPGAPANVSVLQSALSVPLQGRDKVAGVLTLYLSEKQGFTNDHLRLLLAASSKLGLSVENAMQFEQAEDTASTDFLTGLPNARSICAHLERELARCKRSGSQLAVCLCDLNGFKSVNDNFGHIVGNRLLKEVGKNLRAASRECDQIGRLGGDEFVLVLPDCPAESLAELQSRLRQAIEEAGQTICGRSVVTVSIGSAFHPRDGATVDELLGEADQSMYLCKAEHYKQLDQMERMSVLQNPGKR